MKLFNEKFLLGLPEDPNLALFSICNRFLEALNIPEFGFSEHLEVYALIEAFCSVNEMDVNVPPLPEGRDQKEQTIVNFIAGLRKSLTPYVLSDEEQRLLEGFRGEFAIHVKKSFAYEFSEGDLNRIQTLLNELRNIVSDSKDFDEKHRRRLLIRLEKLQQELHKKQSDLDHFWGLVGDMGVAIGKFGKDAKPIVDRIKEITDIVWRTQSRAEELSSDSKPPLLAHDSDDEI